MAGNKQESTRRGAGERRVRGARRVAWIAAGALALLALAALLGPRLLLDTTLRALSLPADLDGYLARAEAQLPNLRPQANRRILWHDAAAKARTGFAVVYLHGFSAGPVDTAPLAQRVAADLGANLYLARLRGHGSDGAAMARATANDWLNDAAEACAIGARLGERVLVIGTSTGATLAVALALLPGCERLHALALISPNFGAADPRDRLLRLPWAARLVPLLVPTYSFEPANAQQARHWTTAYPSSTLLQLAALVDHVLAQPLESIAVPVLTLYAPGDRVIDVERMLAARARIGVDRGAANELVAIAGSDDPWQHTLAGDILSPSTTAQVARRIAEFALRAAAPGAP